MTAPALGKTSLAYVGSRPYIRGADLLAAFVAGARERGVLGARIGLFRIAREVSRDGTWREGGDPDAAATVDFDDSDGQRRRAVFIEDGATVTARVADIPSVLAGLEVGGDFAGVARLLPLDSFAALANALVEADKRLHQATLAARGLPSDGIRLVYMEDLPAEIPTTDRETALTLAFLGERTRDGRSYTLVRAEGGPLPRPARLCFTY